eukprot:TRINITY_DN6850_c0_g1_i1.p1 TRINITY_DN6850_c0_g1~~TRINITY_DN6850_c0_g1_i1.p1  ORF type:complete len:236 (-),score=37.30 TRINITY_DN6850_c0_g1_i1:298-1005(-)
MGGRLSKGNKRILILTTSHSTLGDSGQTTGSWAEELAAPYYLFKDKGYVVDIASVKGGKVPMDEASFQEDFVTPYVTKMQGDKKLQKQLDKSLKLEKVKADNYVAIYLPGGHGTVFDLPDNEKLQSLLATMYQQDKVISAVCHGPSGLVNAKLSDGTPIIQGKNVAGFSNTEEVAVGKDKYVPFLLEDKLKERGGKYVKVDDWQPHAIRDGKLVTGQNPASSVRVAELVLEALSE